MKILYTRVSSIDQNSDRQRISEANLEYGHVIEDQCSGAIPFFERQGGQKIQHYIYNGIVTSLMVWEIDRLGRDLRDILNTIHFFSNHNIPIVFIKQGLRTLDDDGKENHISKLIIGILGIVGEMERNQIRERQLEGIALAKMKGVYKGRKSGTVEDTHQFLNKPQNQKALKYLKQGLKAKEAAQLAGVHVNTITKIRKLGFRQNENGVSSI
jgi:DNA invertase Pin-like site-specific DNA recombinase